MAYKIGQIAILDMKHKARQRMGAAFDIRSFHRCALLRRPREVEAGSPRLAGRLVLEGGALPLNVLEQRVDDWAAMGAEQLRDE